MPALSLLNEACARRAHDELKAMGHKEDRNDVWGCCPTVEDFGEKLTWKFFGHARAVKLENVFKYISDTILDRNDCDSWIFLEYSGRYEAMAADSSGATNHECGSQASCNILE